MKRKKTKKVLAMLLAVSLLMPLLPALPGMSTEVHAAEPEVTQFATKDQLTKDFNLNGGTIGRIKFGANNREWLIAGVDTANNNNTLALLSASSFENSQYGDNSGYSESEIAKSLLPGYLNGTSYFSDSEKNYMAETTVSTLEHDQGDGDSPRTMTGRLYLPDAQSGRNGFKDTTICVGTNNNIPIALSQLVPENGFTSKTFWLRSPYDDNNALVAWPGYHVSYTPVKTGDAVVPAFNLNLSSVLFASAAPAASDGALATKDAMTLRYDGEEKLGSAAINPAQTSVSVSGAPEGTYLVVQNDSGAWAKAVSGDSIIPASDIDTSLTSFANCKVWLENTDTGRTTTAVMAVQETAEVTVIPGSNMTKTGDSGEAHQSGLVGAMTEVVYTADSGYYFSEDYSVTEVSGISVTWNSYTQITVLGAPTADNVEITLEAATPKGEQTAPTGLSDGIEKINGTSTGMEYAADNHAADWTPCTDSATDVTAGTWYVRYAETDTTKASLATPVLVSKAAGSMRFSTKEELTTNFNLNGGTVGRIKFGANNREWLIAGVDTANNDTLALLSASSFGDSRYGDNSRYSDSTIAKSLLPGYLNAISYFSDSEKNYMAETTVSTEDWNGKPSDVKGKLYLPDDAQSGKDGDGGTTICVGTNNNIPIALKPLPVNGSFWLRSPIAVVVAMVAWPGSGEYKAGVYSDHVNAERPVVPAFNLNLSSVLFASATQAALSDGALTTENAMTLRYDGGEKLGSAVINPAQTSVSVSGTSAGTYLVVQNDSGAWAKAVSGDSIISASDMNAGLASFAGCKVWLEKTDTTERITTAAMAVTGYISKIINPPDSHITRSTAAGNGAETQIAAQGTAITNVVYTADSGYYFPENYKVAEVNRITIKRDNGNQITVSGTPTANAEITLAAATEKGEQNAPVGLSDGIEKIDGTKPEMEYAATEDAADWTQCTDNATDVEAGTWYVRFKETDTTKASPATKITVTGASHTITADPAALDFGIVNLDEKGSYTQPEAQTVTVANTGNSAVTLTKPDSTSYVIGELSKATLGAGESATFTVQPKGDLVAGTYSETLEVTTDKGTKTTVALSFTVNGAFSVTIDPASAEIIAGQSQTLTAKPEGGSGSYTYAWYAGDEGDVIATSQEITVSPTTTTTYKVVVKDNIEDKEATATVTVIQASHTITADPAALDFGTVNLDDKGSYIQPEAKTVTVTNTGNSAVTLTKPTSTSYVIGELSQNTFGAGESAAFTVQPKGDLVEGTYSETLEVTTDKGTKTTVVLSFTVKTKSEDAPKIIKGADSKWTQGSKDGLSFTSNAKFDKFKKVMIDGKDIDASHYSVQSGSTIVTLKAEYLETLKEGKHTISIVSENRAADAAFTIVKGADKPAPDKPTPSNSGKDTKTPQTGDNSNLFLWLALLALCGGTITVIGIRKKRI